MILNKFGLRVTPIDDTTLTSPIGIFSVSQFFLKEVTKELFHIDWVNKRYISFTCKVDNPHYVTFFDEDTYMLSGMWFDVASSIHIRKIRVLNRLEHVFKICEPF